MATHPYIVQGVLLNNQQSIRDLGISEQGFLVRQLLQIDIYIYINSL